MMASQPSFRNGLLFTSRSFFRHKGAYAFVPSPPIVCDKCSIRSGLFRAHGRFKRSLVTLRNSVLISVKIWKYRWLCLNCRCTMSTGPADTLPHIGNCTLVIVVLLWTYLEGDTGLQHSIFPDMTGSAEPRTLARYLKRARHGRADTQRAITTELTKTEESRQRFKRLIRKLTPPDKLGKRFRNPEAMNDLWCTLALLLNSADGLSIDPCLLMERVTTEARKQGLRFLFRYHTSQFNQEKVSPFWFSGFPTNRDITSSTDS